MVNLLPSRRHTMDDIITHNHKKKLCTLQINIKKFSPISELTMIPIDFHIQSNSRVAIMCVLLLTTRNSLHIEKSQEWLLQIKVA